jgi:homoserine O-acetyltransferase
MMAMISYRSQREFNDRFGRDIMPANGQVGAFAAESYLRYQGKKLVDRFDANCYVQLTLQMDTHDIARGRGHYESVLASIRQPALVVGIDTDVLYPVSEQEELARLIPGARLEVLKAPYGHDSFLIERDRMGRLLANWLDRAMNDETDHRKSSGSVFAPNRTNNRRRRQATGSGGNRE